MFAICPNKVYKNKDLTGVDIKVYLAIQGFSNENGYCFPSIAKIADICGVCRRTVERSLAHLEELKFIARQKRIKDNGGYTSNGYYLKLDPEDDTTDMSHTIRQDCRIPYDNNVASNNNQINNNIFKNNTRVCTREELGKESDVVSMEHINDVRSCLENVKSANDYNFFVLNGEIGFRPKARHIQNEQQVELIKEFFYYNCARIVNFSNFSNHSIGEQPIFV